MTQHRNFELINAIFSNSKCDFIRFFSMIDTFEKHLYNDK